MQTTPNPSSPPPHTPAPVPTQPLANGPSRLVVAGILLAVAVVIGGVFTWLYRGERAPTGEGDAIQISVDYKLVFSKEGFGPEEAELYLAAQHSAYPGIRVMWPLNVGKPATQEGFQPLPFTAESGDTMKFTLLDDDDLTKDEEAALSEAAKAAGAIIIEASNVFLVFDSSAALPRGIKLSLETLLKLGASQIIRVGHDHPWDNYGSQDFIVGELPTTPRDANPITIASDFGLLRRLDLKVYATRTRELPAPASAEPVASTTNMPPVEIPTNAVP